MNKHHQELCPQHGTAVPLPWLEPNSAPLSGCAEVTSVLPRVQGYHMYIDENLPPESPYLYGLHPNAEIGFLTVTSDRLFRTVLEMQPKESDAGGGAGISREEKASGASASLQ